MLVLKHAFLNLKRHRWQHLLLGSLLFLLIFTTMTAYTLFTSAGRFAKQYERQFKSVVTILQSDLSIAQGETQAKEQYLKIGESDFVDEMKIIGNISIVFDQLKTVQQPINIGRGTMDSSLETDEMQLELTILRFGTTADIAKELFESNQELKTGTTNLKLNECLISDDLAKLNQLSIGDTIEFTVVGNDQKAPKKLTIAGIYQSKTPVEKRNDDNWSAFQSDDVFINSDTVSTMEDFKKFGSMNVSYKLKSQKDTSNFIKEIEQTNVSKQHYIMTNETNKKTAISIINGVKTFSSVLFLGSLIFGVFILIFVALDRFKRSQVEICILKSSGITNKQLVYSRLIELLGVISISFIFALFVVLHTVQPIADWQITSQKRLYDVFEQVAFTVTSDASEVVHSLPISLDGLSFISFVAIAGLCLLIIGSIDSYKIFKFKSIAFLLERNIDE
ncbi:ABC transporter permease [Enterococcus termitis]|uniref:Uncharacterized protein n=1 Tax=Enterococcus termitis TaxID=332950 RepID=A0A1E5GB22_9ENTE|nr:ABC transporter permease [Enterococcus termitis]OEG09898.1 hypothetical protein BCR25_10370 [Enterococcus termitis]OJG98406.1 hypothetical protein RV18_GL003307 [Enterococcus termitis]